MVARSPVRPEWLVSLLARAPAVLVPLLVLTLPLEATQLFFPIHEIQLSRLVMGVCVIVLGAQIVLGVIPIALPARRTWLPVAVFMLYAGISAALTASSDGFKTLVAMLAYGLVALALFNWSGGEAAQKRFWAWFAVSVIAIALVGLVEAVTGHYIWNAPDAGFSRMNATFKDPNIYARFLTIGIMTSIVVAARSRLEWRPLQMAAIVLAAAVLPLTFSRQGWFLGGAVLVVAVLLAQNRVAALGLSVLALAVFAIVVFVDRDVLLRLNAFQQFLTAPHNPLFDTPLLAWINVLPLDGVRHYLIAAGFQMFYDHPIFGVGFGRFPAEIAGPYRGFILPGRATYDSHTSLVTIIAELGVVGLLLVVWWGYELARAMVGVARQHAELQPFMVATALGLMLIVLQSQLEGRLFTEPYGWVFIGAGLAATRPLAGVRQGR